MPIVTEELVKPTNLTCPHCKDGAGCTVYDARPETCAEWLCGWKVMPQIPADFRPFESGLVFRIEEMLDDEITVTILDPRPKLASPAFAKLIFAWHEAGIVLHLEAVGPPGFYPVRKAMNELVESAGEDAARLAESILAAWEALAMHDAWVADNLPLRTELSPP